MVFLPHFFPIHTMASTSPSSSLSFCFASCSRISKHDDLSTTQPWWDYISELKPDAFVWVGDSVYANNVFQHLRLFSKGAPPDFDKFYSELMNHEGYQRMKKNVPRIFGTWDDHDYGQNDGDKSFIHKSLAQEKFLDFLDVPLSSPRRTQKGVYTSETIPLKDGSGYIQLLLLDIRYHRDPWTWTPRQQGDMLGEEQWKWLEEEVQRSTAKAIIIGSGIQILWSDWLGFSEHWNNFPNAKKRLLNLLSGRNVIFISGDVHMAEVRHIKPWGALEITSSGLTHAWGQRPLISLFPELINVDFPNTIATAIMTMLQMVIPHHFLDFNSIERNFSCINFDHAEARVGIFSARRGDQLYSRKFAYDEFLLAHDPEAVSPNLHIAFSLEPWSIFCTSLVFISFLILTYYLLRCTCVYLSRKCRKNGKDVEKMKSS